MLKKAKRTTWAALGIAGFLTVGAFAFFVGSFTAEGTHTAEAGSGGTGSQKLPVAVSFPANALTPTHAVPLTAEVENTTNKTVKFEGFHASITTGAAGCEASWFKITATGPKAQKWEEVFAGKMPIEAKYALGRSPLVTDAGTELMLTLEETGTNQEKCESTPITVSFKLNE